MLTFYLSREKKKEDTDKGCGAGKLNSSPALLMRAYSFPFSANTSRYYLINPAMRGMGFTFFVLYFFRQTNPLGRGGGDFTRRNQRFPVLFRPLFFDAGPITRDKKNVRVGSKCMTTVCRCCSRVLWNSGITFYWGKITWNNWWIGLFSIRMENLDSVVFIL